MARRIAGIEFDRLEHDGFAVIPGLVLPEELAGFERDIALVGEQLAAQRGVDRRSAEAMADVLVAAGPHRAMLFDHVKRLFSVARLSVAIGAALEQAGLFRYARISAPIIWPTLRADLPGEGSYELPLHQDYATTRCRTAWRMWIPLRDADPQHGTMEVIPGSHKKGPYPYSASLAIERREIDQRGLVGHSLELPAGDGVLFSPWLVHGSVPNRSQRTKWVLLMHVQDLATFVNPEEPRDPIYPFLELTERGRARTTLRPVGAKQ